MKQDKARELIKDTFENPFDKERYTWFLKNLFPDKIEFRNKVYTGNYIKEAFRNYIRKYEQIGKFEDAEGNTIDLLAVELLRGQSIERARTSQRNFIAQYLKNKNHREGALVAFYSEGSDDWRFSLIKMEYSLEKKKDELTPAKRFSFLVGKDEKSHTAQKQLTALLTMQSVPLMQEIEASFNIETVTKEFFEKYKQLFLDLHEHIEKQIAKSKPLRDELESKNIDAASFTKKLLGQIVFLYFLQKKGWLGVPKQGKFSEGVKNYMRLLLNEAIENGKTFFSQYLVYLFYEALAKEHNDEGTEHYFKKLKCRIPFLNGGLFEADYDWENITVDIPNKFFTNRNITKEGDTGDGILDVFDRYNFTVKEDEPLDKEVAVDPEMLGKVFENLLTVKDRKSKGAFYTPREIVHYMCQESLIAYLDTELNGQPTSFVKMGDEQTQLFGNDGKQGQLHLMAAVDAEIVVRKKDIETFIREGIAAIENDARVESKGEETSSYSYQLPESIRNHAKEIDKALANIRICDPAIGSGAFPVGMMNEIVKAREILSVYLRDAKQKDRTAYELKRHAIQECIYGVDIDHSAIDIAKLRLWLSLVVDEEDFHKIKPLPNLDYKIVEGNSIVGFPYRSTRYDNILFKLEKIKENFFSETDIKEKKQMRSAIKKEIMPLFNDSSKSLGFAVNFDFPLSFSEVFHSKGGFDIVIGNPPYLNFKMYSSEDREKYKVIYPEIFDGKSDIYYYFYHKASTIAKKNGFVCFITSRYWLEAEFAKKLRGYLSRKVSFHEIVDFKNVTVFDGLGIKTGVTSFFNTQQEDYTFVYRNHPGKKINEVDLSSFENIPIRKSNIEGLQWKLGDNVSTNLLEKIEANTLLLSSIANCKQGIVTGLDKAFITTTNEFRKLPKWLVKPWLKVGDIHRYSIVPVEKREIVYTNSIDSINDFPELKARLQQFKVKLSNRREAKSGKLRWFDLQWSREQEMFDSEKLICRFKAERNTFCFDDNKYYSSADTTIVCLNKASQEKYSIKYILALLNSKLLDFYFKSYGKLMDYRYEYYPGPVGLLRIKETENQKPFISIVDKILEAKKQNPEANTSSRERQLDIMVYHLYNLTYDEAKIIDATLNEEEWEKYKL